MNNNRIPDLFEKLKKTNKKAFIAFITGGDPDIETTEKLICAMEKAGVDMIEIGIPFSDPVAEGPAIEKADERALKNGCTTDKLFDMIKRVREKTNIPLLFMTYINPVYTYGKEKFMIKCRETGIDGLIVPDLPFEEKDELKDECAKNNIKMVSMIAPTSGGRAEKIAKEAEGFLYCVPSPGFTGTQKKTGGGISDLIQQVRTVSSVPCVIGVGISTPEQARDMSEISDGVIVSSAIVQIIAEYGRDSVEPVTELVKKLRT